MTQSLTNDPHACNPGCPCPWCYAHDVEMYFWGHWRWRCQKCGSRW